ncbi:MAG: mechanosensitive ion channel [Proteobacteria bacterium]|nr:mechanosensitive ion channel [Pseudomonadota bacterium]MBU1686954.1 mechanosensitive ion channel [Pseudomonadota bacterium]
MNLNEYPDLIITWFKGNLPHFIAALLIFMIGKWLACKIGMYLERLLTKSKVDSTLVGFLRNITYYTLLVVVLIAAADQLGVNTTSLLTIVGAAGLAVGLALKDSLSNFASGVMIVIFRPFKVGDFISAGGVDGVVEEITIFNTIMKTPDNKKIIVPNSNVTGGVITNVSANPTRRVDMVFGIGYDDDIAKAKGIISKIISEDPRILKVPAPQIAVAELADSSVNIIVRPWVNSGDYWDVLFYLNEKVKTAFDREGVSIPYPQSDIHIHQEKAA